MITEAKLWATGMFHTRILIVIRAKVKCQSALAE